MRHLETRLSTHLQEISVPGNRFTNLSGINHRANYIKTTLSRAGIDFRSQPFVAWGTKGENIIVSIVTGNRNSRKLVIGAHYDTIPFSPGANDNSSSVSCLLTLAEELSCTRVNITTNLELCFWDMEEVGKKGSEFYVRTLDQTANYSAIVLEMLGWRSFKPFSQRLPLKVALKFPALYASSLLHLHRADFHLIIEQPGNLEVIAGAKRPSSPCRIITAPSDLITADHLGLCDSDHHNFWKHNFPAIVITDTAKYRNAAYHTPNDTWFTIDVGFVASILDWLIQIVSS